jgi:predicted restriction endonuclease
LLLSPHVDHLFDRGFISFNDTGAILVSKELNPIILDQWSIHAAQNVGEFKSGQLPYLEYHREIVFQN